MSSLRQLLAEHPVLLLIDSASARLQIGLWTKGANSPRWLGSDVEASTALFASVDTVLADAGLRVADVSAFVFCEGPGSVLGIRTAAVALRAWRVINPSATVYAYQSLNLIARSLTGHPDVSVIADARRDSWHVAQQGKPLRRVPTAELHGEFVMPEHFRHWTALPAGVATVPYDLAALFVTLIDENVFHLAPEPDAFSHEDPSYITWTPQIHQAPRLAH